MQSRDNQPEESEAYVKYLIAHQEDLRAFIHSLLPNSPAADDVLQNTNLVLWQKRSSFKMRTNFHAWAFKIARIQVQHQYDRAKRETRLVFSEELINHIADSVSASKPSERALTILEGCISKLNDKQRSIIDARYSSGKSLELYGKNTNTTAGSLRISLFRIRATLRRCLETSFAIKPS
jgi:RNA polymerase sigma-70 factor, ECF subfamily